jgi:hypothetical protein
MDYDPAVVGDILDFLFLPNFGLDLDILKVEMGGDTDSTEGTYDVRFLPQTFAALPAIGSHACWLDGSMHVI